MLLAPGLSAMGDTWMDSAMEATGERLVPEASDPDLRNEHFARYRFAEPLARGKRVLDAGCGAGYGAAMLSEVAASVYAIDRSPQAVYSGRETYPGVSYLRGDCTAIPFANASLDLVVAFEVIEHIAKWADLIREAARVLVPTGVFLVSTPNRPDYRASRDRPNPFHVHEFDYGELRGALGGTFNHCEIYLENHVPAISLTSDRSRGARAFFESSRSEPEHARFFVGACSMEPLELLPDLAYLPVAGNVLRERELHIAKLNNWIAALEARHAEVEKGMSRELSRLPYRILRRIRLAPRLPERWSK